MHMNKSTTCSALVPFTILHALFGLVHFGLVHKLTTMWSENAFVYWLEGKTLNANMCKMQSTLSISYPFFRIHSNILCRNCFLVSKQPHAIFNNDTHAAQQYIQLSCLCL